MVGSIAAGVAPFVQLFETRLGEVIAALLVDGLRGDRSSGREDRCSLSSIGMGSSVHPSCEHSIEGEGLLLLNEAVVGDTS